MATGDEQLNYPKAKIAMGSGDLVDVINVKGKLTNNAKQVHTLRKRGAGITLGTEESSVSFTSAISENGVERDYWKLCKKGTKTQLRIKIPGGKTLVYNGVYKTVDTDGPIDDAVKVECEFIGKQSDG